jgi:hypothetical protein
MVLGVVVVCLPMMFVGWLLLAARWTKMDALTVRMPEGMRSLVVQAMLGHSSDAKTLRRATLLDPEAMKAWQQQARAVLTLVDTQLPGQRTPPDLQALYKQQVANRAAARALSKKAEEQGKNGKECAAEDLYTEAASKDVSSEIYSYTEGLGRAGLKCGDLPGARAGLEAAILKETNFIKGTDEDQLTDVRRDLLKDREFLVVVYAKEHESALGRQVCSDAHPGWKGCACALGKDGDVKCEDGTR